MNNEKANMAQRYEREIPEGYEARIEGNKVIIEPKESEDERIRKEIIQFLRLPHPQFVGKRNHEEWIAYLGKQKEQKPALRLVGDGLISDPNAHFELESEQKPAEWSEDDDALLKEIVSFFKDGTVKLQHDLNLYAGFLEKKFKSLRPQPHWKPSEEQMKALNEVANNGVLLDLFNDLLKLL